MRVPYKHVEQGFWLGQWLAKQRAAHRRGTLQSERWVQLEKAGVCWTTWQFALFEIIPGHAFEVWEVQLDQKLFRLIASGSCRAIEALGSLGGRLTRGLCSLLVLGGFAERWNSPTPALR